jgi:hypothetical protein
MDIDDNIWFFNQEQLAADGLLRMRHFRRKAVDDDQEGAVVGEPPGGEKGVESGRLPTIGHEYSKLVQATRTDTVRGDVGKGGEEAIRTVEWNMMNKQKFYPLSILSSFTIRCFLYPFSVIKTRIQVQRGNEHYKVRNHFDHVYGNEYDFFPFSKLWGTFCVS